MATLKTRLGQDTAARLEREAQQRGVDLPTCLRLLLGDEDHGEDQCRNPDPDQAVVRQRPPLAADLSLLNSPEAVVAAIRARGPGKSPVQEATADLVELLRTGGVAPGISSEEWDRRWAGYEAQQKALERADTEKTLDEIRRLLATEDHDQ
jgi:hypothetical protein